MSKLHSYLKRAGTLAALLGVAISTACATETDPDGALYEPSTDQLADVRQTLDRAKADDRLALVVLGANWCHDSRALAARLHRSPLAEVIDQSYELVFVDVGYLENGRDVVRQFGVSHYYATPTVLVIDPATEQLINDEDRHQWGDAYKINMSDSVDYFEKWPSENRENDSIPAALQGLYAEIDGYERQLADRVAAGYAVVGPMLAAYKGGNEPEEFDATWDELRSFRIDVPNHIRKLRDEAIDRVSDGETDIRLQYPDIPPLSWETED